MAYGQERREVGITGDLNERAQHMAGLLDPTAAADAQAALRRLSGSAAVILVVSMPLPMAYRTSDRVQNAEHYRDPDNGEPQSHQLPRQPQDRFHAPALRVTRGNVHGAAIRWNCSREYVLTADAGPGQVLMRRST